jgi:hypothetical protein
MGVPIMDYHRQTKGAGQLKLPGQTFQLLVYWRKIVMQVQAYFAQSHHFGLSGQGLEFNKNIGIEGSGVMGMHSDRGRNPGVTPGQGHSPARTLQINPHRDNPANSNGSSPRQDRFQIITVRVQIEMTMGIDQLATRPQFRTAYFSFLFAQLITSPPPSSFHPPFAYLSGGKLRVWYVSFFQFLSNAAIGSKDRFRMGTI